MKLIETYKGIDIKYNPDNGKLEFGFENVERAVRYLFEAKEIIDEPRWEECNEEGYYLDGYSDKYIGKAIAKRKDIKSGKYDWKVKGQYDIDYRYPKFSDSFNIYKRTPERDQIYLNWQKEKAVYIAELSKLNKIAYSIKEDK